MRQQLMAIKMAASRTMISNHPTPMKNRACHDGHALLFYTIFYYTHLSLLNIEGCILVYYVLSTAFGFV